MDEQTKNLNDEGRQLWDGKAEFWDQLHGEAGNRFHQELVSPTVHQLLALQPGEHVLDVACGNGVMARELAARGGVVTAVDFSAKLIAQAKKRGEENIDYRVVDATDEDALAALGEGQFSAITCTMALMDIPTLAPLFRAVRRLLTEDGRFVFATSHPAFNSNSPVFLAEQADEAGSLITRHSMKINAYLEIPPTKGAGARNEPNPHYYYHRPLSALLADAFEAGLVLDRLEEPAFDREKAKEAPPLSWYQYWQIPPVLAGRLRKRTSG